MRIHVTKDGQNFGPYTIDEIKAHLAAGHFLETDHGMSEGTDEWLQISDLLAASDVSPAAVPISEDSSAEDDVDYEKLKQWEEQFEDFEDEEQDMSDEPSVQPSPVSPPPPAPTAPVGPSPTQPTNVESVPQQTVPVPSAVETQPSKTSSATSESPPPQSASEDNDTDKEPPPARRRRIEPEDEDYEDDPRPRKRRSSRRGGSRKISGMNRGQTVIVVKGGTIGSKVFTTMLVLFLVTLAVWLIGLLYLLAMGNDKSQFPDVLKDFYPWEDFADQRKARGAPDEKEMITCVAAGCENKVSKDAKQGAGCPECEHPIADSLKAWKDANPEESQSDNQARFPAGTKKEQTLAHFALTEDHIQQLRTIPVEFYKTDGGKALRCVASVEPDLTVNDEDLLALEAIAEKLVWLDCSKGNLTDAALSRITNLPNIRRLYLEDNKGITSRGVSDLVGLGKLQCLNLVGTSLDDAVIEILTGMSGLREVYLWRSGVSPEAVQRLRTARPDMLVQSG